MYTVGYGRIAWCKYREPRLSKKYYLEFVNDLLGLGVRGFRYDTAKHIGVHSDPVDSASGVKENDFWDVVTGRKSVKGVALSMPYDSLFCVWRSVAGQGCAWGWICRLYGADSIRLWACHQRDAWEAFCKESWCDRLSSSGSAGVSDNMGGKSWHVCKCTWIRASHRFPDQARMGIPLLLVRTALPYSSAARQDQPARITGETTCLVRGVMMSSSIRKWSRSINSAQQCPVRKRKLTFQITDRYLL